MKIKDIVNREIVNLENCEQEPIHIPGSIQPHGFLLGLRAADFVIDYCSGNTKEYISLAHNALLGKKFADVFGQENDLAVKAHVEGGADALSRVLAIFINHVRFNCSIHRSGHTWIFEAEPALTEEKNLPDTYEQTRLFLEYMAQTSSLQELCASVAKNTRELTGYDRVMIYRFDEEYNGEIFAESRRDDLEPFLGLHYPHTDIPAQARELYMKNLLRIIGDINYTPVPIYTIDDADGKILDLSFSALRSTSPIHVQYLQNMGVGATLTISLIHKNRLWGLIACHHYSEKVISPALRLFAQLQGHFITSQIDVRQANEEYDISRQANDALEKLLSTNFLTDRNSFAQIVNDPLVLELCNASGVAMIVGDHLSIAGSTPAVKDISLIARHFAEKTKNTQFHTAHLASELDLSKERCDDSAGLIYHSLSVTGHDCIMWFRGETVAEVTWGGDPNKAIIKDENGLHPRKSFEKWKEVVKCKSKRWLAPELNAAASFAHSLEKHLTLLTLSEEEEKYRKLSEVLKASNEELENVNWISAHDLQEPLRKIQMMSSRILATESGALSPKTSELLGRMNNSASKMQTLLRDILDFVKIKNADRLMEHVPLTLLVQDVLNDLGEIIEDRKAKVVVGDLPEITAIPFLVKQLFINIISNSLKFTDAQKPQVISISAGEVSGEEVDEAADKRYHKISVSDTGIGFDEAFAETIFKIFTRLHTSTDYQGSGVGLALCRKIMQSHDGCIRASGREGEGSSFYLYFPVR